MSADAAPAEAPPPPLAASTPTCALHESAPSQQTCRRCGRFCCEACLALTEPPVCSACEVLLTDPLGLRARRLGLGTIGQGLLLALKEWPRLLLLSALFAVPEAVAQVVLVPKGQTVLSTRVSSVYGLFALIGTQAMLALLIARAEGRALTLGGALREGLGNWGRALGTSIIKGLWIVLFTLLLIIPGVWQAVLLALANTAALRVRGNALERSKALVRGSWFQVFGVLIAASLAAFVPTVILETAVEMLAGALNLHRVVGEFVSSFLDRFAADGLLAGVLLAMFYALHLERGMTLEPMQWRATAPLEGLAAAEPAAPRR